MKYLWQLNKYFYRYKWRFLLGVLFVSLSNYFRVEIPKTIRESLNYALDKFAASKELTDEAAKALLLEDAQSNLIKYTLIILGVSLLMGLFMYLMRQTIIVMSRLIEYDLRKDIFSHLETLDYNYFQNNKVGDLMSRISSDVDKVRMYLGPGILYAINLISLFVITVYAMYDVNPRLATFALIPLPLLSVSIYIVHSRINKLSEEIQDKIAGLNSVAQEVYSGIAVIKSYVKEAFFYKHFVKDTEDYKSKSLQLAKVNALFFPLMILLISISTILTLYIGGIEVANGNASLGNIAEFIIYVNMLTWPFTAIGWIASIVQQAAASEKRILELLDVKSDIPNEGTIVSPIIGNISFKDVSFSYPNGTEALKKVNFDIKAGERIAIVGRTASGKSTLVQLLLRVFELQKGEILIDGNDIKSYDIHSLRSQIAYVPQDGFLFSDSILHNIHLGAEVIDMEEVVKYAKYTSIHKEISNLPEGYDTVIGERGVKLSGGQKQRLSITRALIKKSNLIILDDCLSAVDANTEHDILKNLDILFKDQTVIIITHRLNNVMKFDRVLEFSDGILVPYKAEAF